MPDINDDVPTEATINLIGVAWLRSIKTRVEVVEFAALLRAALEAFGAEVDPLHLSDADYDALCDKWLLSNTVRAALEISELLDSIATVA